MFEQINAGPYKLFVTVRTPTVIPGVATIEVRTSEFVPAGQLDSDYTEFAADG